MTDKTTEDKHAWRGDGPPPPCWREPDGTIVFRDYESYVFDDDVPVPNPPAKSGDQNG